MKKNEKKIESDPITKEKVIRMFVMLFLLFALFYLITALITKTDIFVGFEKKEESKEESKEVETEDSIAFDYDEITAGEILNQNSDYYYVIFCDINEDQDALVKEVVKNSLLEDNKKLYYLDINNTLNNSIIGDEVVINNDLSKFKVTDNPTLIRVKNKTIDGVITGLEDIRQYLGY